jgi:hypothetical protein
MSMFIPLGALGRVLINAQNIGRSASLIGRLGSNAFRLSTTAVSMSLTGSRFSSESAPRPLYGAFLVKNFNQGDSTLDAVG